MLIQYLRGNGYPRATITCTGSEQGRPRGRKGGRRDGGGKGARRDFAARGERPYVVQWRRRGARDIITTGVFFFIS